VPLAGWKQSGIGAEKGVQALAALSELIRHDRPTSPATVQAGGATSVATVFGRVYWCTEFEEQKGFANLCKGLPSPGRRRSPTDLLDADTRYQTVGISAMTGDAVARIIKRTARAAGIAADRLAGHPYATAGYATAAAQNDAPDGTTMRQTGRQRTKAIDGYIRPATVFEDNSATSLGLDQDPPA
jgi:limonene-1,2-epoxide hydrolase